VLKRKPPRAAVAFSRTVTCDGHEEEICGPYDVFYVSLWDQVNKPASQRADRLAGEQAG